MKELLYFTLLAGAQAYLKLDFTRVPSASVLEKRADDLSPVPLRNDVDQYIVQLAVGTPPQMVSVQLDTGSADLWFSGADNPYCKTNKKKAPKSKDLQPVDNSGFPTNPDQIGKKARNLDCKKYGFFNMSSSSTFKNNDTDIFLYYEDLSFVRGTWGTDVVSMGGLNISGVNFAVAEISNSSSGVLGVSLPSEESTYSINSNGTMNATNYQYSNLPLQLKEQGIIDKVTYSIYLNDTKSKYGSILFGAVDHSKYTGTLYTLPLVNSEYDVVNKPYELDITLNGIGYQSMSSNMTLYDQKVAALIDSGTTISEFPDEIVEVVAKQMNATVDPNGNGIRLAKCPSKKDNAKLLFNLGGALIYVDIKEFTTKVKGKCYLEIIPSGAESDLVILGDNFMRSVYTVFDLEANEVSIAQANFNSSLPAQIEEIKSTVPSAVKAPQYYNTFSAIASISSVTGDIFGPEATAYMAPPANVSNSSNSSNSSAVSLERRSYDNAATPLRLNSIILIGVAAILATIFL